ncbi:MAG: hypothetical protein QM572_13630 [Nocardioides sp.]|uniref:MXAN_6640 family putative metalloprotease n=1 Tax=Nocardioides sp. TaxID=35761 RepID=UPI0039E2317F
MRRFVLITVTATALLSGMTPAWAEDSAPAPAPSAESGAADGLAERVAAAGTAGETAAEAKDAAGDALDTVQDLFAKKSRAEAVEQTESGADPTLALRELSLRLNALSRADRNSAYAQFQRPWDDGGSGEATLSSGNVKVHYLPTSNHPGNANATTADWAQQTLAVLANVSATYTAAGYRQPMADAATESDPYSAYNGQAVNWGGSNQTDIYLADLGDQGIYGYCAYDIDDSGRVVYYPPTNKSNVPAFCVLDNDFSLSQYRATYTGETSSDILKVTAAHEYFHAVQFAYDALEDAWIMEATAVWAEHQLYPEIPDNRQYLPYSQLRYPGISLDTWNGAGGALQYGDWIYFEYLTERVSTTRTGTLPNLVRRIWEYADSLGADQYSIQAVTSALAERGKSFATTFGQYAAANRHPATTYAGGSSYPVASPRRTYRVKSGKRRAGSMTIDHLASGTIRLVPKKITKKSHRATIRVNLANRSLGSVAVATIFLRNGKQTTKVIKLNKKGDGKVRLAFSNRKIQWVDLTLVNANTTYSGCSNNTAGYSCGGTPVHDGLKAKWSLSS